MSQWQVINGALDNEQVLLLQIDEHNVLKCGCSSKNNLSDSLIFCHKHILILKKLEEKMDDDYNFYHNQIVKHYQNISEHKM